MFSRRHQLCYFISAIQHHHRAKLQRMEFPYLTKQIYEITLCLKRERLIAGFFIFTKPNNTTYRKLIIYFHYINNNDLLFSRFVPIAPRLHLSNARLSTWIRQKASYLFPILFIQTATHGILTDRQLAHLQLQGTVSSYLGGRLVAKLY
jgi:ribosomal protein S8